MPAENKTRPWILLVEDEESLVATLRESLEDDFEVVVAGNVGEAKALLGSRTFDLILSDHMLPGKQQGLTFLVWAFERYPATKRILMTGYLNPELLDRSVPMAQLSACLIKPFDLQQLRQELQNLFPL